MFTTIIVQPIFNLLVLIMALIPSHNFGMAIVIFTIIIRLLMWPLVKKQLHHAKAMRELQPELKRIKKAAAGDRQKESAMTMELYKEKELNPFASIGILLVQLPILIGLYSSIRRIIDHPHDIVTLSYPVLHHLGWIQQVAQNIHAFDNTLFGVINLTKTASGPTGIYWPAMAIVVASAAAQFLQGRQLMPKSADARSLRQIMSQAGQGSKTDQSEVNAAVGRSTQYLIPVVVLVVSIHLPAALPLYWLVSSTVAYIQQSRILKRDAIEADASADTPAPKNAKPVASTLKVTRGTTNNEAPKTKKSSSKKSKKRRKR
jgi:YidC/Oxa1 family membrane protein insertase